MAEIVGAPEQEDYTPGTPRVVPTNINPNADPAGDGGGEGGGEGGEGGGEATDPWAFLPEVGPEAQYTTPGSIDADAETQAQREFERNKITAQQDALVDIEALNAEYEKLLGSLRGQYQTSETPQEKERLRFILADIEAQHEAGVEAISSLYAETTAKLNEQARTYRGNIEGRALEVEGAFTRLAEDSVNRNLARRQGLADQYRGYGIAAGYDPQSADTRFLESLAPIQGNYSRMIGESTAGGMDFIANMAELQGNAQQGDLKRLAAATRSAAIQTHQAQVDARVQSERAAARGDRVNLQMAALSARESAMDLNARLMNQAIQAEQFVPGQDVGERYANMTNLAATNGSNLLSPDIFARSFASQFGGSPPPEFREMYIAAYHSAAISEIMRIQDNLRKLEIPAEDPRARAALARMNEINSTLDSFGLTAPPPAPAATAPAPATGSGN